METYFKFYSHHYIYISHNDYFYCLLSTVILWFIYLIDSYMEAQGCISLHDRALHCQQCDDCNPNYIWPPVSYWVKNNVCSASNHSIRSQRQIRKDTAYCMQFSGLWEWVRQCWKADFCKNVMLIHKLHYRNNTYLWMTFRPLSTKLINQIMSCMC